MKRDTSARLFGTAILYAATVLSGCAAVPTEEMATARSAILAAGGNGPDLARAENKMALANRWVAAKDYGPARWLAEQAAVDAELAAARGASQAARIALAERESHRILVKTSFQQASTMENAK